MILLDILLPDIDGFEICKRMRSDERLKSVPVIFLTAESTSPADGERGLTAGACDLPRTNTQPVSVERRMTAVLGLAA